MALRLELQAFSQFTVVARSVKRNLEEDSLLPIHHLSYDTPPRFILWQNRMDGEKGTRWSKWIDDISSEFMCKYYRRKRVILKGVDFIQGRRRFIDGLVVVESGF